MIDCSEIFIQWPSRRTSKNICSQITHHNTLNFLVGTTPYGTVSVCQGGEGGGMLNNKLTEKSGFYNRFEYGYLVLADRCFNIAEELAVHGAFIAIPPFGRGKKKFSQQEVKCTRRLSRAQIYVERATES